MGGKESERGIADESDGLSIRKDGECMYILRPFSELCFYLFYFILFYLIFLLSSSKVNVYNK